MAPSPSAELEAYDPTLIKHMEFLADQLVMKYKDCQRSNAIQIFSALFILENSDITDCERDFGFQVIAEIWTNKPHVSWRKNKVMISALELILEEVRAQQQIH